MHYATECGVEAFFFLRLGKDTKILGLPHAIALGYFTFHFAYLVTAGLPCCCALGMTPATNSVCWCTTICSTHKGATLPRTQRHRRSSFATKYVASPITRQLPSMTAAMVSADAECTSVWITTRSNVICTAAPVSCTTLQLSSNQTHMCTQTQYLHAVSAQNVMLF